MNSVVRSFNLSSEHNKSESSQQIEGFNIMQMFFNPILHESILLQFREPDRNLQVFGDRSRGRIQGQLIAVRKRFNGQQNDIENEKHFIGLFACQNSLVVYDGEAILFKYRYSDIKTAQWKWVKYSSDSQPWMLWEFGGLESSGNQVHILVATYGIRLYEHQSDIADIFYEHLQKTDDQIDGLLSFENGRPDRTHDLTILRPFRPEKPDGATILPYIAEISDSNFF